MTFKRFLNIWKYRYDKGKDILISVVNWMLTCLNISFLRLTQPHKKLVCILLAEHFGDIVACEPILRELKKNHPNAKIFWIVKKPYKELLIHNPNVDVIIEEFSVLYSILLSRMNPFHSFHNLHLSGLRKYSNIFGSFLNNPLADSLNILTENYFNHGNILEVFSKVGGLPIIKGNPIIYIPKSVEESVERLNLPKRIIVVHCHSNYSPKDWQVHYWERLVNELLNKFEFNVIEIGLESTLTINHPKYLNFCGKLSLLETAEVIKRADYFIGIDSGPAHFANAVGTYGFLLFGKLGDFNRYMPYSGMYEAHVNVKYIIAEDKPCSELSYDDVWETISSTLQEKTEKSTLMK